MAPNVSSPLAMNIEAPTFNALNKPQKRALILRDQLRFLDPHHIDSFLEGISENEPPRYTKLNGVIKPELALVTLKEEANYFDLGNVLFPENKNAVHRVYLVAENGQVQMRMEDPLPLDDDVLDSLPIHGFIARGMIPLFKEKFNAMQSRMNRINEARRMAHTIAGKTPISVPEGQAILQPNPPETKQIPKHPASKPPAKPKPNHEANQHISKSTSEDAKPTMLDVKPRISNKRKRAALDTIPEEANSSMFDTVREGTKSRILDTIPSGNKISLFNAIVNTAFTHLDNLITASCNVVAIYSAYGSDSAALDGSIDALKRVLQDFDQTLGKSRDQETLQYRQDFEASSQIDEAGTQPVISTKHDSTSAIRSTATTTFSLCHPASRPQATLRPSSHPVPQSPQPLLQSPPSNDEKLTEPFYLSTSPSSSPDSIPHTTPHLPHPPSTTTTTTSSFPSPSPPHSSSSPSPHKTQTYTNITALHQDSVQKVRTNATSDMRQRTSSAGAGADADADAGQANFLGHSLLGARKNAASTTITTTTMRMGTTGTTATGVAPVVNMVPVVLPKEKRMEKEEGGEEGRQVDMDM